MKCTVCVCVRGLDNICSHHTKYFPLLLTLISLSIHRREALTEGNPNNRKLILVIREKGQNLLLHLLCSLLCLFSLNSLKGFLPFFLFGFQLFLLFLGKLLFRFCCILLSLLYAVFD